MSGSADNPLVVDDWDRDVAPRRATASKTYVEISSASESPPPATKPLPLRGNARAAASSLKPPSLPKRTSLRSSSGPRTSQDRSATVNSPAAGPQVSPKSSSKRAYGNLSSEAHDDPPLATRGRPRKSGADGNDHDMEDVEKSPAERRTRTTRDSLDDPDSQESFDRSIGSTSPLLVRLKEQRGRGRPPSTTSPQGSTTTTTTTTTPQKKDKGPQEVEVPDQESAAMIESFLVDLQRVMSNDHATAVRWTLHDARRAVVHTKPICVDEKSPFESLTSVRVAPGDEVPEGAVLVNMESMTNKKNRTGKSKSMLVSKTIKSDTPRVPRYSHNTTVRRNILTMDDEKLRYIPYMGDAEVSKKKTTRLLQELEAAYNPKATSSGRESEWSYQVRGYLDYYLDDLRLLHLEMDKLVQYALGQFDESSERNLKDIDALLKQYDQPLQPRDIQMAKAFSDSFYRILNDSLRDTLLPEDRLKQMAEQLKKPNEEKLTKTPPKAQTNQSNANKDDLAAEPIIDRLGTYTTLTCLICGAMSCQTHGDSVRDESAPGYHQYIHQPLVTSYQDILRKQDAQFALKKPAPLDFGVEDETPCGPECYLIPDQVKTNYDISPKDVAKIESMAISLREKKRRPCTISFFVTADCWVVNRVIQNMEPRTVEVLEPGRTKHPDWYNNQKKTLKWDWQDLTTAHLHQERCQANPCAHDGPCLKGCPCYDSLLLCESICGCSDDCPRKFTGCACHSAGQACVSDGCICVQMNRECGPECSSCGAIARLNPDNRYDDDLFTTGCQNIHLQRGISRKLILGESQLEGVGFGLYLGEPVRKGEFLSEYAGEVISFLEADRRGITYDRKYVSFLFDLNSEWAIDAARLGNKSRFINHADNDKDGLNCEAKIVLVNGEHRIKFMALRDIKVGEELLFNYGKKFADKHGLNKKLPKAKEGSKRGVVVGEEALEALDGLTPASRETRGKMTAIRGGHGGRGRKARKMAPTKEPHVESEKGDAGHDIYNVPLDDEEEDEGEDARDGRKKRKIVRPARYTR